MEDGSTPCLYSYHECLSSLASSSWSPVYGLSTRFNLCIPNFNNCLCIARLTNKSHKLPFNVSTLSSSTPLDLIYSDVWTSPVLSNDMFKYYVIFVDHYTHYIWFIPLQHQSDTFSTFLRLTAIVENYFKRNFRS